MLSPVAVPSYTPVIKESSMTFTDALDAAIEGRYITRPEWPDGVYGLVVAEMLHIHYPPHHEKAGLHTWVVSIGDIQATDWMIDND